MVCRWPLPADRGWIEPACEDRASPAPGQQKAPQRARRTRATGDYIRALRAHAPPAYDRRPRHFTHRCRRHRPSAFRTTLDAIEDCRGAGRANRLRSCPVEAGPGASLSEQRKKTTGSAGKAGKPAESTGESGSGRPGGRPALTERQRIEARRKRMEQRRRRQRSQPGNALSRGVRATAHEASRTARFLARSVAAAFEATGPVGRRLRELAAGGGKALVALAGLLAAALGGLLGMLRRGIAWLDRTVTPRRATVATGALALILLVASQFTDFRATEIGQPGYGGIEEVITAPRVDVRTPIGAHSVLLLIVAAAGAAGLLGAARSGNRRAAWLMTLAGAVTVVVSLAVDLPAGLDLKEAAIGYSGTSAVLLSGFWMQLAAGVALAVGGLILASSPAPAVRSAGGGAGTPRRTGGRVEGRSNRHAPSGPTRSVSSALRPSRAASTGGEAR